jgi:hypothetical protein
MLIGGKHPPTASVLRQIVIIADSSVVGVIRFVVHDQLVVNKVKRIGSRLKRILYHLFH